jgi:hypothetical protein
VSTVNLPSPSELQDLLRYSTPSEREQIDRLLRAKATWELLPGPQTQAARTEAFETLFGGQAGGGKSEAIAWLALNEHHHSLVLRRSFPELERTLIPRMLEKYPSPQHYNQANHVWRFPGGKRIDLGYLDNEKDVFRYQGAEIDGFFPDELTQFPRDWYLYIFSRIRTTRPGQRTRAFATTNPGGENEAWVKERWGPWLDNRHPNPAQSGEVRWYRRVLAKTDYSEEEVPVGHDSVGCQCADPDHLHAWSRTFIRAGISDNPFIGIEYRRNLDMLPEPYRSQLKRGDWNIGTRDSVWQVIPTAWIIAAQERWKKRAALWCPEIAEKLARGVAISDDEWAAVRPPADIAMSGYGLDVARGGIDWTVHVPEYVDWYAWPLKYPGTETPDGLVIAEQVASIGIVHRHPMPDRVEIKIDIVGVGSSPYDILRANRFNVIPMNGGAGSEGKDKSGMPFANKRAEWYWTMREDLDPTSGADVCLPPHPEVLGDLAAPRWKPVGGKIQIEPKDDIKKRIGRSPDVGDTIVNAHGRGSMTDGSAVLGFYKSFAA